MDTFSLSDYDLYLFNEGRHWQSYRLLGAHVDEVDGVRGVRFALWAPRAHQVRVVGDFNEWQGSEHAMSPLEKSGVWSLFVPGLAAGELYKYEIHTASGQVLLKADPYAFAAEYRPGTASRVCNLTGYPWQDGKWRKRQATDSQRQPMLIYEVHAGSWRRQADGSFYTYRQLADDLVPYVKAMGFTHIEFLPLAEHPLDLSWGYQITGYYAVTSRYGQPQDFMYLVDCCHQQGLGVIIDWVPGHFCKDDHGLRQFDGSPLYEPESPTRAEHAHWGTANFDFDRRQVWSFLISNALFWLEVYHIDGLRVDAVASMLYLDYGKSEDQWQPNEYGGKENLAALAFLRQLNSVVRRQHPQALVIAEESTAWPLVTRSVHVGGVGFNYKWNMGWMNDILRYMENDPIHRKWNHHDLTFSLVYAFAENYILPLSHDEVVHGKGSLIGKMPGTYWQKFANLRLLYGYMLAHPGKKLLFMGGEFAQFGEWSEQRGLDWQLLEYDMHHKFQHFIQSSHAIYHAHACLWESDGDRQSFSWIDCQDYSQSVISFRRGDYTDKYVLVVCNFTPVVRQHYRIGVIAPGHYRQVFNSDALEYGGRGQETEAVVAAEEIAWHNCAYSVLLTLPPLAVIYLQPIP